MSRSGSVAEALGAAVDALRAAGVEDPRLDAELLLSEASGLERVQLVARPETPLDGPGGRLFGEMVRRRLRREPVAYIIGRRWFRHLELRVDRRALIPRPETELLVEVALELGDRLADDRERPARSRLAPDTGASQILDIGTGSGAIAVAIAAERADWRLTATDSSPDALSLARENAQLTGLSDRVELLPGTIPAAGFDIVVANLPYVRDGDWTGLAPEIRKFEPQAALLGGPDGLGVVRNVVADIAARWTGRLPLIALEIGSDQAEVTEGLLKDAGWPTAETRRDLAGLDRVVIGLP